MYCVTALYLYKNNFAGHDNYYHQSHPFVFERRLKAIFKAIGNNCYYSYYYHVYNYYYCYHDNFYYYCDVDFYTSVYNIGIDLLVRNIAQGANNCLPYDYCYESMGKSK